MKTRTFYNTDAQEHAKVHTFDTRMLKSMQKCIHSMTRHVQEHVKTDTFYNTDAQEQAAGSIWLNEFMLKGLS